MTATVMVGGAERLHAAFRRARAQGRPAIIPYVTAGDPDMDLTRRLVPALVAGGADIIEIGLPFSDPLADGPTIQRSGQRALAAGTTPERVWETIAEWRQQGLTTPVVALAYYNMIFRRGEDRLVADAAAAGVDGLIVPDLPPEEASSLRHTADAQGVALIPLAAPTSTDERLQRIARGVRGFLYTVSVTGVTGARRALPPTLPDFVRRIRQFLPSSVPVALGFGISSPAHARRVAPLVDGVIVGSALVQHLEEAAGPTDALERAAAFVTALRNSLQESILPP